MNSESVRWWMTGVTAVLFAVHLVDLFYIRTSRRTLHRIFRAHAEDRDERLAYADRLAHIIRGKGAGKRIKAFESAQHKLTEHHPLNRRERYWLRHPVYRHEKYFARVGYCFWPCFIVCLFMWQILPYPFSFGRS